MCEGQGGPLGARRANLSYQTQAWMDNREQDQLLLRDKGRGQHGEHCMCQGECRATQYE